MRGVEVLHALRGGTWGVGIPFPLREGYGEGLSPENFSYFLLKIPYFDEKLTCHSDTFIS